LLGLEDGKLQLLDAGCLLPALLLLFPHHGEQVGRMDGCRRGWDWLWRCWLLLSPGLQVLPLVPL
jgi:hypothetical protein